MDHFFFSFIFNFHDFIIFLLPGAIVNYLPAFNNVNDDDLFDDMENWDVG